MTTVTLRIKVDNTGAVPALSDVKTELAGVGTTGTTAGAQAAGGVDKLSKSINDAKAFVGAFVTAWAAIQTLSGVQRLADEYSGLSARIALAVGDSGDFVSAQQGVIAIANQTGTSLSGVGTLFSSIAQSTRDLGLAQSDILTIAGAVSQSLVTSGASAAQASAAVTQLAQAFGSGVLRGDEFNSIAENAPALQRALADALGVSTGELRKMAEQGQLTSGVLANGILTQADAIKKQFDQIPRTVGQASTALSNSATVFVGAFDASTGASQTLAKEIDNVAAIIVNVANAFVDTGPRATAAASDVGILTTAFQILAGTASLVVNVIQGVVQFALGAFDGLAKAINAVLAGAKAGAEGTLDTAKEILSFDFAGAAESIADRAKNAWGAFSREGKAAADAFGIGVQGARDEADEFFKTLEALLKPLGETGPQATSAAAGLGKMETPARKSKDELAKLKDIANDAAAASKFLEDAVNDTAVRMGGPAVDAALDLAKKLGEVEKAENALRAAGRLSETAAGQLQLVRNSLIATYQDEAKKIRDTLTPAEQYLQKLRDEIALAGLSRGARDAAIARINAEKTARELLKGATEDQIQALADEIVKLGEHKTAAEDSQRAAEGWRDYWTDAVGSVADTFADWLANGAKSFSDFGKSLKRIAQQIISDLISTFLRTRIVIPITAALTGQQATAGTPGGGGIPGLPGLPPFVQTLLGGAAVGGVIGGPRGAIGGAALGLAGSIFGPIGTIIGSVIGGLIGGLLTDDDPLLRVRSSEFSGNRRSEGRSVSQLGNIFVRTENLGDGAPTSPEIANRIRDFDNLIAGFLNEEQLSRVRSALANVNATFRDGTATLERALGDRLSTIVGQLSEDVQRFVGATGDLETRMNRLADALTIEALISGPDAITTSFDELADLLTEFRVENENLAATYQRLSAGVSLVDFGLELVKGQFEGTRLEAAAFAGELIRLSGGFDQFAQRFDSALRVLFTDEERAAVLASQAQRTLNQALTDLGVQGTGVADIREQLRALFQQGLETGDANLLDLVLRATSALGLFTDSLSQLGEDAVDAYNDVVFGGRGDGFKPAVGGAATGPAAPTQADLQADANRILGRQVSLLESIEANTRRDTNDARATKSVQNTESLTREQTRVLNDILAALRQQTTQTVQLALKRAVKA